MGTQLLGSRRIARLEFLESAPILFLARCAVVLWVRCTSVSRGFAAAPHQNYVCAFTVTLKDRRNLLKMVTAVTSDIDGFRRFLKRWKTILKTSP
ncbi:hypothetical protein ACU8KH_01510 [Lachancea thermotolerans]